MRKLTVIFLSLILLFSFTGCKSQQSDTFNVGTLKGPTGIGMIQMIENNAPIGKTTVNFTLAGAPDEITAKLLSGELDAAAIPLNMAPLLYNKTGGKFVITSVITLGVIYVVENGQTVNNIEDLKGKTIYTAGKGSTADIAFQYTLKLYGIDPQKDVTISYMTEHAEVAAKVMSDAGTIALLPEPFVTTVTMKNAAVKNALDITKLYNDKTDSSLMMSAFVVNSDFAEKYPGTVNAFLKEYKKSVDFVNGNVDQAAALVTKYGILASADIASKAIPRCNIVYMDATTKENKQAVTDMLQIFYDFNPATIGGKMPGDDFWYAK
jgi:NitT/TauT family transport system substrate-binding protein